MKSSIEKLTFVKGKRPILFYFLTLNFAMIIINAVQSSSLIIQIFMSMLVNLAILYLFYLKKNPSFLKFEDFRLLIEYNYIFNKKIEVCEYSILSFSYDRETVGRGQTENTLVLYIKDNLLFEFNPLITGFSKEDIDEIIGVLNNKKITQVSRNTKK